MLILTYYSIPRNISIGASQVFHPCVPWRKEIVEKNEPVPYYRLTVEAEREYEINCTWQVKSYTPPPSILHVCRESRKEALKHYTLEFGAEKVVEEEGMKMTFSYPPRVYINWKTDRPCLLGFNRPVNDWLHYYDNGPYNFSSSFTGFLSKCYANGLQQIAITIRDFEEDSRHFIAEGYTEDIMMEVPSLKEVILIDFAPSQTQLEVLCGATIKFESEFNDQVSETGNSDKDSDEEERRLKDSHWRRLLLHKELVMEYIVDGAKQKGKKLGFPMDDLPDDDFAALKILEGSDRAHVLPDWTADLRVCKLIVSKPSFPRNKSYEWDVEEDDWMSR